MAATFPIVIKTLQGLEEVLATEMQSLGIQQVRPKLRSVAGVTDMEGLMRANLWLRTALFVLRPLHHYVAKNTDQLYAGARDIDWTQLMEVRHTFMIRATVHSPLFTHSQFAALRVKDAIVDQFQEKTGQRPNVDTKRPHLRIDLHISRDRVTISLDSSGEPLFKRGYRLHTGPAPLNEVLAAGMILQSGWEGNRPFWDPMCGSGTLPIEAALIAYGLPPQLIRQKFAFQFWPWYDKVLFQKITAAFPVIPDIPEVRIKGSDKMFSIIKKARANADALGIAHLIDFHPMPIEDHPALDRPHHIIINPPYDERLPEQHIVRFYRMIGHKLKTEAPGSTAWIISANKQALKKIGMKAHRKIPLKNGPLESSFREYLLYT